MESPTLRSAVPLAAFLFVVFVVVGPSDLGPCLTRALHYKESRLTAVLKVFADGTKAPLTVILRYKKPKSFPRHFDSMKDLDIFSKLRIIFGTRKVLGTRL